MQRTAPGAPNDHVTRIQITPTTTARMIAMTAFIRDPGFYRGFYGSLPFEKFSKQIANTH
jgi:hypothetical protein